MGILKQGSAQRRASSAWPRSGHSKATCDGARCPTPAPTLRRSGSWRSRRWAIAARQRTTPGVPRRMSGVRSTHAAREGRVFAWADPPDTGHPGKSATAGAGPRPYYGTPLVSDTSLPLRRQQRFDASGSGGLAEHRYADAARWQPRRKPDRDARRYPHPLHLQWRVGGERGEPAGWPGGSPRALERRAVDLCRWQRAASAAVGVDAGRSADDRTTSARGARRPSDCQGSTSTMC